MEYDYTAKTLKRGLNRIDSGKIEDSELSFQEQKRKLATKLAIEKKMIAEKRQGKKIDDNFILSDSTAIPITSTPIKNTENKFATLLNQSDYEKIGLGNKVGLKDSYQLLFDGEGFKKKINTISQQHGLPDGDFNIFATLEKFSLWYLLHFSILSESIIVFSMIFYSLFTFFYKMKNGNKNGNSDMKLGSKFLLGVFIFNLLILPIIMTVFFNTKYGLLH